MIQLIILNYNKLTASQASRQYLKSFSFFLLSIRSEAGGEYPSEQ